MRLLSYTDFHHNRNVVILDSLTHIEDRGNCLVLQLSTGREVFVPGMTLDNLQAYIKGLDALERSRHE